MARIAGLSNLSESQTVKLNIKRVLIYIFLIILTLLCLFPLYQVLINMTRSHGDISISVGWWFGDKLVQNWQGVFARTNIKMDKAILNSLLVAFCSATLATYFSSLTAFGLQVYHFKGSKAIFTFILIIMMIPTQVSAVGFVDMIAKMGQKNTLWPLFIPSICSPVVFFYMKQYMESVLPMEMIEAARVDGASEIRIFHQMVLPIVLPAIAVQFIFAFVGSWNNLLVPSLLIDKNVNLETIPIIISKFNDNSNPINFDLGQVYVVIFLAIIPLIVVYLCGSRFIIKGMTEGSVKG